MSETAGGRHSSDDQISFYRSAIQWFLPWIVMGVVAIGALWIAIDALGNDGPASSEDKAGKGKVPAVASTPQDEPSEEPTENETEPSDSPEGVAPDGDEKDKDKKKKKKKEKKSDDAELIVDGISVQVLNGTQDTEVDDKWADELEGLGFEIAAVNPYSDLGGTTVYWSSVEAEDAARVLAEKFGWQSEPKPEELSSEVDIHLYLGDDEL